MKKLQKSYMVTAILFLVFVVYTILVKTVDVQTINIQGQSASIGFATINQNVWNSIGTSEFWYHLTEYIGYATILVMLLFTLLAFWQMVRRKNFFRADFEFLALGGFYVIMLAFYVFFEKVVVNVRPVLEEGSLEASYPSSHTMLVCCVMVTAIWQWKRIFHNQTICLVADTICVVWVAFMVFGRLLSGVHWLTDIIGGVLLSAALVMLYYSIVQTRKRLVQRRLLKDMGGVKNAN